MSICLCMVVKNEEALIREALRSALPFIDRWVIVDTGSTDGTIAAIYEEMGTGLPGKVIYRPWKNYGHNRTEALKLAQNSGADFILLLDADETLEVPGDKLRIAEFNKSVTYWMTVEYGTIRYGRPNLIPANFDWQYVGVTHEYLTAVPQMPPAVMLPVTIHTNPARCTKSVERCLEDARILNEALIDEPTNGRYVFYLAQSLRDAGDTVAAIAAYEKRTDMGGWMEETWYAQFQVGQLKEKNYCPENEVVDAYLKAYDMNPSRAESLGALARYLRQAERYHSAYLIASRAVAIPPTKDQVLFVDDSYANWRCLDEFSIAAYWTGHYKESLEVCKFLLTAPNRLPTWERGRVEKNMSFAEKAIESK